LNVESLPDTIDGGLKENEWPRRRRGDKLVLQACAYIEGKNIIHRLPLDRVRLALLLLLHELARRCHGKPCFFFKPNGSVGNPLLLLSPIYLSTSAKQDQQTIANKMINANKNQPAMFGSWLLERSKKSRHRSSLHHHK
jgi:hypothetical protein